ncbi:MAG: hypothetical protein Q9159_001882 [Coniocarpon cinnabarinum]
MDSRKRSAPTPYADTNPWIDDLNFTLNPVATNVETRKSLERSTPRPKREIPRLDLTKLFTRRKSGRTSEAVTSPLPSPPLVQEESEGRSPQQVWQQITNPWGIRIRKAKSAMANDILNTQLDHHPGHRTGHSDSTVNSGNVQPAIKYWFDYVDDGDDLSIKSEPEGRPSLSSERSLSKRNRDTFLSISSSVSGSATSLSSIDEPDKEISPSHGLKQFSMSTPLTRKRNNTLEISPVSTLESDRPTSKRSQLSVSTIRNIDGRQRLFTPTPSRQPQQLPDSINKGESVLVLSETEDSDEEDGEDRYDDARSELQSKESLQEHIPSICRDGTPLEADVQVAKRERLRHVGMAAKRLNNAANRVSHTVIDDGSQISDDHSPRTSLLSDLRPISFRSEYRPQSFVRDEPHRLSTLTIPAPEPEPAWLHSPSATVSQLTPSSSNLPAVLSEPALSLSRPHSARPEHATPKAKRIMVVTDAEARLLSSIRRRRAEMMKQRVQGRTDTHTRRQVSKRSASKMRRSRSSFASFVENRNTNASASTAQPSNVTHDDGLLSPISPMEADPRRPSSGTVNQVWKDVQAWRKQPPAEPVRNPHRPSRPPLAKLDTDPAIARVQSPMTASSPRSRIAMAQRMASDGVLRVRPHTTTLDEELGHGSKRRSQSLGEKLARRDMTDVKADVLAAWGDLGGWRRSTMSPLSPMGSSL